jgi:hypothetical protein
MKRRANILQTSQSTIVETKQLKSLSFEKALHSFLLHKRSINLHLEVMNLPAASYGVSYLVDSLRSLRKRSIALPPSVRVALRILLPHLDSLRNSLLLLHYQIYLPY